MPEPNNPDAKNKNGPADKGSSALSQPGPGHVGSRESPGKRRIDFLQLY